MKISYKQALHLQSKTTDRQPDRQVYIQTVKQIGRAYSQTDNQIDRCTKNRQACVQSDK